MVSNNTFSCLQCSQVAKMFLWVLYWSQHVLLQNIEMRPCRRERDDAVTCVGFSSTTPVLFPYLVTKKHWLDGELFVALVASQLGKVTGPTFCWFLQHICRCFGLSLAWEGGKWQGCVGRDQWGHRSVIGMVTLVGGWRQVLGDRWEWVGRGSLSEDRKVPVRGDSIHQVWIWVVSRFLCKHQGKLTRISVS